jgi:hypothetical protein
VGNLKVATLTATMLAFSSTLRNQQTVGILYEEVASDLTKKFVGPSKQEDLAEQNGFGPNVPSQSYKSVKNRKRTSEFSRLKNAQQEISWR